MQYEEQVVNGVLSFRTGSTGDFTPFDAGQLTSRIAELEAALKVYTDADAAQQYLHKVAQMRHGEDKEGS